MCRSVTARSASDLRVRGLATTTVVVFIAVAALLTVLAVQWAPGEGEEFDPVSAMADLCPIMPAGEESASASMVAFHDHADHPHEGPRIATLLPFAADQLLAMGVTPVCVPGLRDFTPDLWGPIPTVQLDHSAGPNLEQLLAVDPDFIVTGSIYAQFMPQIEEVTGAEIIMMDVESVDSVMEHVQTLGRISNRMDDANRIADALEAGIKRGAPPTDGSAIDVLAIFGTPHSFYAFLPESYLGDLVYHAGGNLGPEGLVSHKVYRGLAPLSMEMVIEFDPDLLLVLFHGPADTSRAMFEGDPLWNSLRAVHEDRMHFLSDDLYAMRPGSQVGRAMAQVRGFVEDASRQQQ